MSETVSPARPRSWWKWIGAIVVVLLLLYAAWPYYSIWRFREAIRAHDMTSLSARVDFAAVRGSLKQQLRDKYLSGLSDKQRERLTQFLNTSASDPLDELLDAYLTPEGVAALISDPDRMKNASTISSIPRLDGSAKSIDWSKFGNAFFTSPRDFVVEHEEVKLGFRCNGLGWKLHTIDLQLKKRLKS